MLFQKRLVAILWIAAAFAAFSSCSKKGGTDNTPVVANFTYSGAGLAPATVTFTNSSTGATSYQWDFGDNSTSTSSSPSHNYMQGGVYTVRLTANGPGGSNSVTKTVNIGAPTTMKITGVKVTGMPFTTPSGGGWDPGSGPDVFFEFKNSNGTVLFSGATINDVVAANLPLSWTLNQPYSITNFSTPYSISVIDYDPADPNDPIGSYDNFTFSSATTSGYPTTLVLQSTSSQLKIEFIVQWQ